MTSKLQLQNARILSSEEQKLITGALSEAEAGGTYYCTTTGKHYTVLADCVKDCTTECLVLKESEA